MIKYKKQGYAICIPRSPILILFFVLMLSTGCDSTPGVTTKNETTVTQTTSSTSIVSIEEVRAQLFKTGSAFVSDVKIASELTGYSVATPSFIPDGFIPVEPPGAGGAFNIFKPADPAHVEGIEYPYSVNIIYSQTGEYSTKVPYFQIGQSRNRIGAVPEGEPVQIGEYPGKRTVLSSLDPPRLALTWNDETMYYALEGLLIEPLDEATLIRIAVSMKY